MVALSGKFHFCSPRLEVMNRSTDLVYLEPLQNFESC